ncbi:transposon Tn10 TetD protein [Acetobacterium wieringae]|uniref:Transposon Tn10 TetD protein n=1 Tax=Acetobacterium wieringae TaxID=52694 RepID=A0A1F2PDU3_9FIRM|nr:transposon Tn10 TetD protein [Acetobacterium wieringae]
MDSLSSMNNALTYIESHLTEVIDFKVLSKIALCSEYHFKRMFSFLSGISLSEYIRRRRLTLAALELKDSNLRIIDIAMKYEYGSADSFSRAFYSVHGILPSEARNESAQIKAFPRMTFQLSIQGGCEMNYRIVEKEPFRLVGYKKRVPMVFSGVNPEITKMYELLTSEVIVQLKSLSNIEPTGMISASTNFPKEEWTKRENWITILVLLPQAVMSEILMNWKLSRIPGPYLNQLDHFLKHYKKFGAEYILNGFRHQVMNP